MGPFESQSSSEFQWWGFQRVNPAESESGYDFGTDGVPSTQKLTRATGLRPDAGPYGLSGYPSEAGLYGMAGGPYGDYFAGYPEPQEHPKQEECAAPLRVAYAGMAYQVGGVEQHLLSLVKFFDPRRVKFEKYLCTIPSAINPRLVAQAPFAVEAANADQVRAAADEYDVLMLWGQGFNGWIPATRKAATVFVAHGESQWCRDTLIQSSQVTDHAIAISRRVLKKVCAGFPSTLIHNGVDTARLATTCSREAARERLGFAPGDFVLGTIGRFSKEKRTALLIEAARRLPRDFKLVMVGWGSQRPHLMNLANELIPCRYAFVNADNYLGDYYQAMDAFCLLSEHEGFSLAAAEALLCRKPLIATDVGFVDEFIQHNLNGYVFDGTVEGLVQAARQLREHSDWASGIAGEGHRLAHERFHAAKMSRAYEDLFEQLCRAKRGAAGNAAP